MDGSSPDGSWFRTVLMRGGLIGLALGVVGIGGSHLVLIGSGSAAANAAVLTATFLLALTIGIWAGAPDATREHLPLRERWLSAATAIAVGGAFATLSGLYQQVYPTSWWQVAGLIVVIGAPCYALGLLLPVVLQWADRWLDRDRDERPAWGATGPLVIGLLLGAALATLATGFLVLPRWSPTSLLMLTAVLMLLPIAVTDPASVPPREAVVFKAVTPFGQLEAVDVAFPGERQAERRLYLNGEEESGQLVRSGAPTLAYIAAAESWLTQMTLPGGNYLFLGGGAYTLPRRIAERDTRARITVVELDPEVTLIAYRYFGVKPQHGITSIEGDARAFLDLPDEARFDRIYVDVYGGNEALPHSIVTLEAAESMARRLNPLGVVAMNLIGTVAGEEARQPWSVVMSFAAVFPNLALYTHLGRNFPERQNLLLAATMDGDRAFPQSAGLFERWDRTEWPVVEGARVFRDLSIPEEPGVNVGKLESRTAHT